ncbi:UNVERIFIED_CONTAM: hypothetical protein GTU68_052537 [Idotea baltica]|nr:hypothetical protein [Idotea baltica]
MLLVGVELLVRVKKVKKLDLVAVCQHGLKVARFLIIEKFQKLVLDQENKF